MSPEDQLESAITQYLDWVLPSSAMHFHIPNSGKRGWQKQREMKNAGLKTGMPDRCILWNGRAYFIEAKPKGRYPSAAQKERMLWLEQHGHPCAVCRSIDDVAAFLQGENIID